MLHLLMIPKASIVDIINTEEMIHFHIKITSFWKLSFPRMRYAKIIKEFSRISFCFVLFAVAR